MKHFITAATVLIALTHANPVFAQNQNQDLRVAGSTPMTNLRDTSQPERGRSPVREALNEARDVARNGAGCLVRKKSPYGCAAKELFRAKKAQ